MLAEVINAGIRSALLDLHTACPGIVISFDPEVQTVKVLIAVKRLFNEIETDTTVLVDIPVLQLNCADYSITMPVQEGDEALIVFSERCIDGWFEKGGAQLEPEHRVHDLSDGFAIIGLNCKNNAIPSYETGGMAIRNRANDQKITLFKDGSVVMDCPGGLTVNGETTINGNTTVVGEVVTSANVVSIGDHIAGEISLKNHLHVGVQSGPSKTGKPVVG